ncbi:hypothetical protein ACFLS8_05820, partial [Chloroflexota bacterium]
LGLGKKRRYQTLMVRTADYLAYKALAIEKKKNLVDLLPELMTVYLKCEKEKHEAQIADLLQKQDVLVDELLLYRKRIGKIYR